MNEQEIKEFLEGQEGSRKTIKKVNLPQLQPVPGAEQMKIGLDFMNDITVQMSARLGFATIKVRDLINLDKGSVLQLDRPAGETVDIFINEKLFARGEVVVIGNNFGLRVDRLFEPEPGADRVTLDKTAGEREKAAETGEKGEEEESNAGEKPDE